MRTECTPRQLEFQGFGRRQVVARFDGGSISSDGGGLLLREADRQARILQRFAGCFVDYRRPELIEHSVAELVAQRVYGLALGYEDLNDHDELRWDPLMGLLAGKYTAETTFPDNDERSRMVHRFKGAPFQRFLALTEQLKPLAADKGLSMVQFAIAWILRDPAVTCVLCGAKNAEQARDYLGAVDVIFSADELAAIDAILVDVPRYRG